MGRFNLRGADGAGSDGCRVVVTDEEKLMRQHERRYLYQVALAEMPAWETWSDERPDKHDPEKTRTVNHVKAIPRSVRRDMARKLAARRWVTAGPNRGKN
jgi:hypothetical protein